MRLVSELPRWWCRCRCHCRCRCRCTIFENRAQPPLKDQDCYILLKIVQNQIAPRAAHDELRGVDRGGVAVWG